jgi:hypothetical protein
MPADLTGDDVGAPEPFPLRHDHRCELSSAFAKYHPRPKPGECWCVDRADGYEHWMGNTGGAGNHTLSASESRTPPNMLGGAA